MQEEKVFLYYTEGTSDKVYQCYLEEKDGGWMVRGMNGKRGSALKQQQKTTTPVPFAEAKKIYDKLVIEKKRKGYTPEESGEIYQSTVNEELFTGIVPQLLNPYENESFVGLYDDSSWIMQEKYDGERRMILVEKGVAQGISRRGMVVPLPESVAKKAEECGDMLLDGEIIGTEYFLFDILSLKGKDLKNETYEERYKKLLTVPHFTKAGWAVTREEKEALEKDVRSKNGEGLVGKDRYSLYVAGRPNSGGPQLKNKFTESATLKVGEQTKGKRSVALHDNNGVFLGKVTVPENHPLPEKDSLVEVGYLYRMPQGGALFQPVYKGLREDKTEADDCATLKEKPTALKAQKRKMSV